MIGKRLKEIRKQHCMTQKNVAESLGIDRTTYTFYEIGKTRPSYIVLLKLANIYNVSLDYLLGRDFEKVKYVDDASRLHGEDIIAYLPPKERSFLMCYRALSKTGKEKAVAELKRLAEEKDDMIEDFEIK